MHVLVLDGHNLIYRSFVTLPSSIARKDGTPINGVYGLLGTILRLTRELQASNAIIAFDTPEVPTFRHDLYPAYQGQRGPLGGDKADDFSRQVTLASEVLPKIGVPVVTYPRYEADDIMATLAFRAASAHIKATLVSSDRDLFQLVKPGIEILPPRSKSTLISSEENVKQQLGVAPSAVTTFKALAGDGSDNIPGVAGIGSRTAVELVNRFGSLEEIYQSIDGVATRVATALAAGKELAFLFRDIVTLRTNLDLAIHIEKLPLLEFDSTTRARRLLQDAGYE